jgi:hypothetical protein
MTTLVLVVAVAGAVGAPLTWWAVGGWMSGRVLR